MVQKGKKSAESKKAETPAPKTPVPEEPKKPLTPHEQAAVEVRGYLEVYKKALINNFRPYEMIKHLREQHVITAERGKEMRRAGKGNNQETGEAIFFELLSRGKREYEVFIAGLRKQDINLLADLLEEKHTSKLIDILEPCSKKLGHHWKRLSIELGTAGFVPKVETKYSRIREQALYSLLLWEETSGISATEKRLLDSLEALEMKRTVMFMKKMGNPKSGKKKKRGKGKGKKSGKKKK